ncbi:MAG: patatin-like phospholipase family protein [Bacteroidota bacterium]|jgi:NTE family protein
MNTPNYSCGIVLSGGGARGFAHIGVLKALNEHGIYPEAISAVSAGAIVGVLYADGYTPDEIYEIIHDLDLLKVLRIRRPRLGVLKADGLRKVFSTHMRHQRLEELPLPVTICATNFTRAHTEYFEDGNIIDAVLASSAIPLMLKPVSLAGNLYVDGGLMNNLPVEPLINKCRTIIGVNVNPVNEISKFKSFRNFIDRVVHLSIRANVLNNIQHCTFYLEPPHLMDYHWFKLSAAKEIVKLGYDYTKKTLQSGQISMH